MGRAMGFGSEPTFSIHVVRQQRMRARAWGGAGVELWKNVMSCEVCYFGVTCEFRVTRVKHLCGKRARG